MNGRGASILVGVVLVVSMLSLVLMVVPDVVEATTLFVGGTGPGNYTTIQSAVENATAGDTIFIYKGPYYEKSIEIDKPLSIIGERREWVIIYFELSDTVLVDSDWVNISGLTVNPTGSWWHEANIVLNFSRHCRISDNRLFNNLHGYGLYLKYSDDNIIQGNLMVGSEAGIVLVESNNNAIVDNSVDDIRVYGSSNNSILNNTIYKYTRRGIDLRGSTSISIANNILSEVGITISGDELEHWNSHVIEASNTVNGRPIYYWKDSVGGTVPSGAGQVILANCSGVIVENQDLSNGSVGVLVGFSTWNTVAHNSALYNALDGIRLFNSEENTIENNSISWNEDSGIYVRGDNNSFFNNTLRSNVWGIYVDESGSISILGSSFLGNFYGVYLRYSHNCTIARNMISHSKYSGIFLLHSLHMTLRENVMEDDGILFSTGSIENWNSHTIDTTNTVNGRPVYYLKNTVNWNVQPGLGQLIVVNCTDVLVQRQFFARTFAGIQIGFSSHITVDNSTFFSNRVAGIVVDNSLLIQLRGSTFMRNEAGIYLWKSFYVTVTGNYIYRNNQGLEIYFSDLNLITHNTFFANGDGILMYANNNWIHHNNFIDNFIQAKDYEATSRWDDGYPSGGNYWNDYRGKDSNGDGLGDTPYYVRGDNQDRYPLMSPVGSILPHPPIGYRDECPPIHFSATAIPRPPTQLDARLSGKDSENVTISWDLSPDDGSGQDSVSEYKIYRNETFSLKGLGYTMIASVPNGTREYVDVLAGEGNSNDYFYLVCVVDRSNYTICTSDQVGKFTQQLSKGTNLLSVPLVQKDRSVVAVLQTVKWNEAWTYDPNTQTWKTRAKAKPYGGDFGAISHEIGFWINITEESNLTVAGIVPLTTTIHLKAGWNLIGSPSFNTTYTVGDLKAETGATVVEGFDATASPYYLKTLQDSDILMAGSGYWVHMSHDTEWVVCN